MCLTNPIFLSDHNYFDVQHQDKAATGNQVGLLMRIIVLLTDG